jgi:large subunit ribosomal protein L23
MKYSIAPHITEKAYRGVSEDTKDTQTYTFKVTTTASKTDVKNMVESTFKVTVEDVRTVSLPGKVRRFKGKIGHTNATKKAIVRLKAGDRIAAFDNAATTPPADNA